MVTKRIYTFDGTWADRNSNRKPTILSALVEFLSVPSSQQEIRYFPGLGTRYGMFEKYLGGGFGHGIENNILAAIDDLATNYSPQDEIIIIGYSRGAYIARCVAGFLNRLGLPQCDRDIMRQLYSKYTSGSLLQRGVADRLLKQYNCRQITIKSLICIDTVGSLGIPRTGLFGLFHTISPPMRKYKFLETDIESNVEKVFHALALHEHRGPFQPTPMHVPKDRQGCLKQVYFLGNHCDVGTLSDGGSLGDIILASILQQLHDAGIKFNCEKIAIQFPRSGTNCPLSEIKSHDWVHDPIQQSSTCLWRLFGKHTRRPGVLCKDDWVANESIHASVRLRGYGVERTHKAIKGYSIRTNPDHTYSWHRDKRTSTNGANDAEDSCIISEEPFGEYEAWLHGVTPG
ncbi:hypothetical protein F4774DRAFT_393092 [Daldinia eschscholtzii]|nr:hypothetical protein F4774DRAFT_393092 [Daldinia eschscholtzii]